MANSSAVRIVTITRAQAKSTPATDTSPFKVQSSELADALRALESEAYAFSQRFITDDVVRADYRQKAAAASKEISDEVRAGRMTAHEGAKAANALRNAVLDMSRAQLSDLGLALSVAAKKEGKPLDYFQEQYAKQKFGRAFGELTQVEREVVWREIVDSAGRGNKKFNIGAKVAGLAGRTFLVIGLAITVWHVLEAENKTRAVAKEVTAVGGSGVGAAAGAAIVGAAMATPPGWIVTLAILVGAAVGGVATSAAFDYFLPEHPKR